MGILPLAAASCTATSYSACVGAVQAFAALPCTSTACSIKATLGHTQQQPTQDKHRSGLAAAQHDYQAPQGILHSTLPPIHAKPALQQSPTPKPQLTLSAPGRTATVRKGAFIAGQATSFTGKIIYPECRKPVFTPSGWDPALVERSSELPNARLVLEHVYGYAGELCLGRFRG